MIKKKADGTKYYYYYKKKVGRHKKTGKTTNKYNKTTCKQKAKLFKTFKEFRDNEPQFYKYARQHNLLQLYDWLVDDRVSICKDKVDCVYMYMFNDYKTVYIGRTLMKRQNRRDIEHLFSNDCIVKFCKDKKIPMPNMIVIEDNLTLKEGLERENYYVKYYKNLGYNLLNVAKTGLGSGSIGCIPRKCII